MGTPVEQQLAELRAEVAALTRQARRRRRREALQRRLALVIVAAMAALGPLGLLAASFTDLNAGSPHNGNINAIADAGITKGCNPPDNDQYCPNDLVTREQMASFLARTAGLGTNPPVANAKTAQTATTVVDGAITPAKLSATGATSGQLLTATGSGVAWQDAPTGGGGVGPQGPIGPTGSPGPVGSPGPQGLPGATYARTIVVSPVGTATDNGTALRNAINGIAGNSATNPFLVKIEPGTYDLGNSGGTLTLKEFVDVEGADEKSTIITHQEESNVFAVSNMELRSLTVECTGGSGVAACTGLRINGAAPTLTHVTVRSTSTSATFPATGIFADASSATIQHSTIVATGGTGNSFGINYQGSAGNNTLTIRHSTITVVAGSARRGINTSGAGTKLTVVEHSRISTTAGQPPVAVSGATNTVRVIGSQLDGGAPDISSGGILSCAGVYDEGFVFSAGPACP